MNITNMRRSPKKRHPEVLKAGKSFIGARNELATLRENFGQKEKAALNAATAHQRAVKHFMVMFDRFHTPESLARTAADAETARADTIYHTLELARLGAKGGNSELMNAARNVVLTEDAMKTTAQAYTEAVNSTAIVKQRAALSKEQLRAKRRLYGPKD